VTASVADFIASPDGELYGRYCEAYGKDPGAVFSDDVVAFQVGLAYLLRRQPTPPLDDSTGIVTDLDAQIRNMR
jgi:hypothetical protein